MEKIVLQHSGIVLFIAFLASAPLLMIAGYLEGDSLLKLCPPTDYHEEPDGTLRYDNGTIAGVWTRDPVPLDSVIPGHVMAHASHYYHMGIEWVHTKIDSNYETYTCLES